MSARHLRMLGIAAAAAAVLAAPTTAKAADEVKFSLDWVLNGTHAGYFTALAKGYYRDAGLEVTISRGFGSGDTVKRVGSGAATFGVADTGTVIASLANEDIPVRIVAMIYQKATLGLIYLEASGIKKPQDLEGRTIGRSASGASVTMFPGFLKANNIERGKIHEVVVDGATYLPLLLSRKVDAVLEQSVQLGHFKKAAAAQGQSAVAMRYSDYGLAAYGNAIIANPETLKDKPDMVRRFVAATLKGVAYALAHPEEAVAEMRKSNPEVEAEGAQGELVDMKEVSITPEVEKEGLGIVDAKHMTETRDIVTSALSLKQSVPVEQIFTTAFLPKPPVMPAK
ncbi:MAG TPA: ABC transporter substrate-binding protein [Alphaproteobacteria bacterium]|nr:ABC transporter substrate-binding protein [Alphaproteobacteria bacterium]